MSDPDALSYIEGGPLKNSDEERVIKDLLEEEFLKVHRTLASSTPIEQQEYGEHLRSFLLPSQAHELKLSLDSADTVLGELDSEEHLKELCGKNPMIALDLEARSEENYVTEKFDLTPYQSLEPPNQYSSSSIPAWQQRIDQLKINSEFSSLRLANLTLLEQFGVRASIHVKKQAQFLNKTFFQEQSLAADEEQTKLNQARKIAQIGCSKVLKEKINQMNRYVTENDHLESVGLAEMRSELERVKRMAKRRKVIGKEWRDKTLGLEEGDGT